MKIIRTVLGVLLAFVALNAFGGGIYGMTGAKDIPVEWLSGSPFRSYFVPGLFLFLVVGGVCLFSSIALFKRSKFGRAGSFVSAILMLSWILVQVSIIGYVSWMQPAIFIVGLITLALAWFLNPGISE